MNLLAPLFLAGLGLLIVPWLIHRIQRPERRPVRFSSLLFIPRMDKEVVQRRRLQHLLLLLMRMAVLALLAFAFSRPFLPVDAVAVAEEEAERAHVLLVDRSASMGAQDRISEARTRAREIAEGIPEGEPLALVAFDETPRVLRPFGGTEGSEAGGRTNAARRVDDIEVSQRGTAYQPALIKAQSLLESVGVDGTRRRGVIHLVGDLQEAGFGRDAGGAWKLPPGIDVRPTAVGARDAPNRAVTDIAVRPLREGEFRVSAKVKNWTMDGEARFPVTLVVDGEPRATETISVQRHHATQVAFDLKTEGARRVEGWIELEADALEFDNRRYFAWNPPPRRTVAVIARNEGAESWPSGWFIRTALQGAADSPYDVRPLQAGKAALGLGGAEGRPHVVVAGELDGADPELHRSLLEFVKSGGQALLTLKPGAEAATLNAALLDPLGLRAVGAAEARNGPAYRLMSWIDFDHPVFHAFQAPQFNDFSAIRVFEFVPLKLDYESRPDAATPRVLVRLEDGDAEGPPAMVEVRHGRGRALIWTFPLDPRVTNLPKSARFAPIVLESVRYLTDAGRERDEYRVGEPVEPGAASAALELRTAEGEVRRIALEDPAAPPPVLERAGLLRLSGAEDSSARTFAVNVEPGESDPVRLTAEAFRLRVMPAEAPVRTGEADEIMPAAGRAGVPGARREFGLALLLAVMGLLFVELWYAPRLVQ